MLDNDLATPPMKLLLAEAEEYNVHSSKFNLLKFAKFALLISIASLKKLNRTTYILNDLKGKQID